MLSPARLFVLVPAFAASLAAPLRAESLEAEVDAAYREPRTVERVLDSLRLCEDALAKGREPGILWRAARACSWLAKNAGKKEQRVYAERGAELAKESMALAPRQPEGYFYYSLNLGILSRIDRTSRWIRRLERMGRRLIEVDERYQHGAGRRLLGLLYLNTHGYPFVGAGSLEEAEEHLRRACELAPDYGYNQLSLAKVLIERKRTSEARAALGKVIDSKPPADEAKDHESWVVEAKTLLADLAPRS